MGKLFSILPKSVIATLAIAAGIAFIIMSEPPHTICDSQLEVFKKAQQKFLFLDTKKKAIKTTQFEYLRDFCMAANNPGGCYELFQDLKMMLKDLSTVPSDCNSKVGDVPEVKRAIWKANDLLVRLAWGEKPPSTYFQKFGVLDKADISLFCQMKAKAIEFYGESEWESFREKIFKDLPGAQSLARNQIWEMSIISENCSRYP